MKRNTENIFVIAQKEFADCIWSSRFWLILGIFLAILFVDGYETGLFLAGEDEFPVRTHLAYGYLMTSHTLSVYGALVAIGLGFDAIGREMKSGSLNVLLTHPVYRDLIITGKFIGMAVALGLVTVVSVMISSGIMLYFSGITVSVDEFYRIVIYLMLVFLFMLSYLALSITISTFTKEPSHSLLYNIAVWLILAMFLSLFATIAAETIAGKSLSAFDDNFASDPSDYEDIVNIRNGIRFISPFTHFDELVRGPSITMLQFTETPLPPEMEGLFDTRFTLNFWVSQYWVNLVALIVMPVILLIISYMAFLRKDITL